VLVVEDIGVIAGEIAAAVEALGCTVLGPADSVAGALRLLTGRWPDAALLDVQLGPRSMSSSIAEVLRAAGVPFAAVTGYAQQHLTEEPVWQGVPYLAKPFTAEQVQELVRGLLAG
jgi:CheY-like chemotaxis protein